MKEIDIIINNKKNDKNISEQNLEENKEDKNNNIKIINNPAELKEEENINNIQVFVPTNSDIYKVIEEENKITESQIKTDENITPVPKTEIKDNKNRN